MVTQQQNNKFQVYKLHLLGKMYNVRKPSKIVTKSRRGVVQSIDVKSKTSKSTDDSFDRANNNNNNICEEFVVKGPKLVFQSSCKRLLHHHHHQNGDNFLGYENEQVVTPQHEEIVNFISNSWNCVCSELDSHANSSSDDSSSHRSDQSVCFFEDDHHVATLADFQPFDLESWWGKRLYTCITNSVNANLAMTSC